ncbi:hypothetical protein PanWU01x14_009570 [Parasponia andersonii]|uniref:Uncharacterized protein n=1 Tax=Parasponia andersonii TaxID=3476 RepID=A0A2P5E2F8_PARAD|nr:hypothetical protein PanWU01x14_009570 [Parasponia andersonii]
MQKIGNQIQEIQQGPQIGWMRDQENELKARLEEYGAKSSESHGFGKVIGIQSFSTCLPSFRKAGTESFNSTFTAEPIMFPKDLDNLIQSVIPSEGNEALAEIPSNEDIISVVQSMNP